MSYTTKTTKMTTEIPIKTSSKTLKNTYKDKLKKIVMTPPYLSYGEEFNVQLVETGLLSKNRYINWVYQREQYLFELYEYFPLEPKWIIKPKDARYKQLKKLLNVMPKDEKDINTLYEFRYLVRPRTKLEIKQHLEWKLKQNADMVKRNRDMEEKIHNL